MGSTLAHAKWFSEVTQEPAWRFFLEPATLAAVGGAVVLALAWRAAATRVPRPALPFLAPLGVLAPWIPRLLAIHAGVSLLSQAVSQTYLAPGLALPEGPFGTGLAILEGLLGVWLITGVQIRAAAGLLVLAGPLGMLHYGPVALIERADLLGIALFLTVLPPGRDRYGAAEIAPAQVMWATWYLRLAVGAALVAVAFTEKLIGPELTLSILERHPVLNVGDAAGLPMSPLAFVRLAGAVELLFGLLIVSGAMPQLVVIAAGIPFNATLFFFGPTELIGHLPIYGAMLVLLVYGSDRRLASLILVLRPWRAQRDAELMRGPKQPPVRAPRPAA